MYFSKKKLTQCTKGSEAKPQKLRNFREFFVLKVCKVTVTFNVSYRIIGEQDVLVAPQ